MFVTCPWCKQSVPTISQRSSRWRGEAPTTPLARLLIDAGLELIEDWISCRLCGFNGEPIFDRRSATDFVNALDREAGAFTDTHEWDRARRRYVRMLAIFPDYSLALLRLGSTFIDAPDCNLASAERILLYGDAAGEPRLAFYDYAIGKLYAATGRIDDARWRLRRYIDRNREATEQSPFPNDPIDQTDDARKLYEQLPVMRRRTQAA